MSKTVKIHRTTYDCVTDPQWNEHLELWIAVISTTVGKLTVARAKNKPWRFWDWAI